MRSTGWRGLTAAVLVVASMGQTEAPNALVRAHHAYNAGQFDAAIAAATDALKVPDLANAAAVVLGRAYLERFRQSSAPDDLDHARKALQLVVSDRLAPRDRVEFQLGLGLSLYLDDCDNCFSASAEMFKIALAGADDPVDRERVFEWWAGALDRQAQFGPEGDRIGIYRRILEGADAELAKNDRSASAWYWLAAAARGSGDLERAWAASIAGWTRARTFGTHTDSFRADLDRFVLQVLLPERARQLAPDQDARPQFAVLTQQWEEIKKKYS